MKTKVLVGITGSYCNHEKVLYELSKLTNEFEFVEFDKTSGVNNGLLEFKAFFNKKIYTVNVDINGNEKEIK